MASAISDEIGGYAEDFGFVQNQSHGFYGMALLAKLVALETEERFSRHLQKDWSCPVWAIKPRTLWATRPMSQIAEHAGHPLGQPSRSAGFRNPADRPTFRKSRTPPSFITSPPKKIASTLQRLQIGNPKGSWYHSVAAMHPLPSSLSR